MTAMMIGNLVTQITIWAGILTLLFTGYEMVLLYGLLAMFAIGTITSFLFVIPLVAQALRV
tara:strand:+ start:1199 stop:1381 length:183 start_codon:yes stop_codon:yes gene_type:complete